MSRIDKKKLRQALGQYMTGVTIVTPVGENNEPIGVTANSFSSVSLDPPLILWSLSNGAHSRLAFQDSEYFCIHVLTDSQQEIAEWFARTGADKFGGLQCLPGIGTVPLLPEYVALFQCKKVDQHLVGDHIVFFGEVLQYDKTDERSLVFHGGRYSLAERRRMADPDPRSDSGDQYSSDRRAPVSSKEKS